MKIVYGIDSGLNGGITIMINKKVEKAFPMPTVGKGKDRIYDLVALRKIFLKAKKQKKHADVLVVQEKTAAHKVTGKVAIHKIASGSGEIRGMCAAFKLPMIEPSPVEWMKKVLKGSRKKSKKDKPSIQYVQKRFPDTKLTATKRSKKPHDGITDSICIALFGFMDET